MWRLVQDHVKSDLLFAATEFGIFFTVDGGEKWIELPGGVPTISFRDLAIQRRENDLVGASFGRGFFVLDDYTPLRQINDEAMEQEALLFPVRKTTGTSRAGRSGRRPGLTGGRLLRRRQPALRSGLHLSPRGWPEIARGAAA